MLDLPTLIALFRYNDWADTRLLDAASPLDDAALDTRHQIGPGSLRRTLIHIHNGESVWLRRWIDGASGTPAEPRWPSEAEPIAIADLAARFHATWAERDAFLAGLTSADLSRVQGYRDSKGSLFEATLGDMILQAALHSVHHRAQAVNLLRRVAGVAAAPELDYMMWVRRPLTQHPSDPGITR